MENTNTTTEKQEKIKLNFKDSKYATGRRKRSIAKNGQNVPWEFRDKVRGGGQEGSRIANGGRKRWAMPLGRDPSQSKTMTTQTGNTGTCYDALGGK